MPFSKYSQYLVVSRISANGIKNFRIFVPSFRNDRKKKLVTANL